MGRIPPKTWENCRETFDRKSGTHSYDDLVDLLIESAMKRENDSHKDMYLRKNLRRETPAVKGPGGRLLQPHTNPGKGRGGQLNKMKETPPSNGNGAPNPFYCRPPDNKRGPCHAPNCDQQSACLLQPQRKRKTKDGQEVKQQDHLCCTITCGYCSKRRHFGDECHTEESGRGAA